VGDLIEGWLRDVSALAPTAGTPRVAQIGVDLLARWSEPHRRYHGVSHLAEVLAALDELADAGAMTPDEERVAKVAGWLHDAVYEPGASPGANEAASAALAERLLPDAGLGADHVRTVVELVRMTADHAVQEDSAAHRAFHDADLWILAADGQRFDAYCRQVREEYAAVPDAVYGPARSRILRDLALGGSVYLTAYAREDWEVRARANLARELARLS
jgi:predicted metal-dependent HD superfamily phosphohydrolase